VARLASEVEIERLKTAKINGIDPRAWLADVLSRLRHPPARRVSELAGRLTYIRGSYVFYARRLPPLPACRESLQHTAKTDGRYCRPQDLGPDRHISENACGRRNQHGANRPTDLEDGEARVSGREERAGGLFLDTALLRQTRSFRR
jgi:hypothetical protein